jgi:hypothetical protein
MKRYLLILTLFFLTGFAAFAQEGDNDDRGNKLQEKMRDYIQKKLNLTKNEAERFSPVFIRYIVELRRTHNEYLGDKPMRQLKVAELRVRFRNEFKQIVDEQRANKVYDYQREFEIKIKEEIQNRRLENQPIRRNRSLLE